MTFSTLRKASARLVAKGPPVWLVAKEGGGQSLKAVWGSNLWRADQLPVLAPASRRCVAPQPVHSPRASGPAPLLLQVCNISWSRNVNEIVSTHGYSQNQIIIWKYPNMSKLATLTGRRVDTCA